MKVYLRIGRDYRNIELYFLDVGLLLLCFSGLLLITLGVENGQSAGSFLAVEESVDLGYRAINKLLPILGYRNILFFFSRLGWSNHAELVVRKAGCEGKTRSFLLARQSNRTFQARIG